jgi:Flp pilus assembly pilin Flp
MIKRFLGNQSRSTANEYGLIAMLVAIGPIAAFVAPGGGVQGLFGRVQDKGGNAMNNAGI